MMMVMLMKTITAAMIPLLMAFRRHRERGGEVLPLVLPPPWHPPLDGERFPLWSLAFMAMMAPPRSFPMASGDDGPLQQGAREGLDWFFVATEAYSGGTPDLGFFRGFLYL